ncbi:toll/interleukin-1 receptor domain-containing protein [Novosphingobium clariflavum]|uniref:Toll/interleukin-1 receptor domain-containing protein n=1 Tax=Novosphingobium clariflavum TaxID=2029884 RepID=A0ABV6S451_9SPHN|nr:toll/interleukin-1 receptor domain-containing protein [Novosphingobium clariflavum]
MRQYITRANLIEWGSEIRKAGTLANRYSQGNRTLAGSTFLSHSSKDRELVAGATLILENHGAQVYIDEIDPEMPPTTSRKTADILKSRIRDTKRFVLLASSNSKDSRWVPWELGYADGHKGTGRIAVFPAVDVWYDTDWTSQEYLGLYDRIIWGDIVGREDAMWIVLNEEANTAISLRQWLQGY